MNASRVVVLGLTVLAVAAILAATVSAQALKTSTDITGTGTINVKKDIQNTNGSGTTVNISPVVVMNGNVGGTDQNITATIAGADINFTTLKMQLASPKKIDTDISVSTDWQLGDGVTGLSGAVSFTTARTISVADASSYGSASAATLDFSGGTVAFTKVGAAQTILNKTGGLSYGTLSLSGTGPKSFQAGGTVTAATVTHAGGDLTVNQALSITGSASLATIADVTAAMSFGAGATSETITAITNISTGSLTNNATAAALSIGTLTSNAGTIANTAGGGISFTTTAANGTGTIETSGSGNVSFAALTSNTGTIRSTGTATGGLSFTGAASNSNVISGVSTSGAISFGNTLANSGTGLITAGGGGITFTGNVTNSANITAGAGGFAANLDFNATTVDNTGGTITLGAQGTSTFAGSFAVGGSGTLALNAASVWTYDGGAQSMAAATYGILQTAGTAASTKTALGAITATEFNNGGTGDVAITTDMHIYALSVSGAKDNTNGTLRLGGASGFSFGTLTAAGGTVIYDGVTADVASQSLASGNYYNLSFAGDATKNIGAGVTVSTGNNVSLVSSVVMNIAGTGILNVGQTGTGIGTFALASGSTLSNSGDVNVAGDLTNDGSLTNNGTITVGY